MFYDEVSVMLFHTVMFRSCYFIQWGYLREDVYFLNMLFHGEIVIAEMLYLITYSYVKYSKYKNLSKARSCF